MKTDLQTLKDSFHMGYDAYEESRVEASQVWDMYHNRQWDREELSILQNRGQPTETFNVIKLFARMLVGYYSTVMNTVRAEPVQVQDQTIASLMTDTINAVFNQNRMETEGDEVKLTGIISGLMCAQITPIFTGRRDQFGRPLYNIEIKQVYDYEIVLDPMSKDRNYEDARFLHRFKWLSDETIRRTWGQAKLDKLTAYHNFLEVEEAEFDYSHGDQFQGRYKVFDNYLIVHTVIEDDNDKRWNIFWSDGVELERTEITTKEVKWPYRVVKLHTSSNAEYYGIFREILQTQKAINQALVKLQLMANTQKVFVEDRALSGSVADFTDAVNRVHGIIPVKKLEGIRVENLSRDALEQYQIIDRAFDRIQRILSVNDSFLGLAFASDSGRKVKLQQNATVMALRYLTVRIEAFYELLGRDLVRLIKQYFTANQVLRITDALTGNRYIELNKPMMVFSGQFDAQGQPIMQPMFEQVLDPETGKPEETEDGQLVFAPIPEEGTEFAFTDFDITIESVAYNDEDERVQLMLEQVMSGQIGQMTAQVNPVGFFQMSGLLMRTFKTKYSPEVSKILEETAQMLAQAPEQEQEAKDRAGSTNTQRGSRSGDLKLPTNTNQEPT